MTVAIESIEENSKIRLDVTEQMNKKARKK